MGLIFVEMLTVDTRLSCKFISTAALIVVMLVGCSEAAKEASTPDEKPLTYSI